MKKNYKTKQKNAQYLCPVSEDNEVHISEVIFGLDLTICTADHGTMNTGCTH